MDEIDIPRFLRAPRRIKYVSAFLDFIRNPIRYWEWRRIGGSNYVPHARAHAKRIAKFRASSSKSPEMPLEEAVDRFIARTQDGKAVAKIPAWKRDRFRIAHAEYLLTFMPVYALPATSDEVEKLPASCLAKEHSIEIRGGTFIAVAKSDPLYVRYQRLEVSRVMVEEMIDVSRPREKTMMAR
ncbi:MAG: hypothetical protein KF835_12480 [Xanthobacteraceae bacterium]|nr:hypothetical protein [Xanthobacteraceae bacterium]